VDYLAELTGHISEQFPRGFSFNDAAAKYVISTSRSARSASVKASGTSTEIAAHPLTELVMIEHETIGGESGGNVAWDAAARLLDHRDRRTDLAGCAVSALEAVMFDKGLLKGVQRADKSQAFDVVID
jgi:hypothetical protein